MHTTKMPCKNQLEIPKAQLKPKNIEENKKCYTLGVWH